MRVVDAILSASCILASWSCTSKREMDEQRHQLGRALAEAESRAKAAETRLKIVEAEAARRRKELKEVKTRRRTILIRDSHDGPPSTCECIGLGGCRCY
jgi:septal ring factor EnvC (AmiA/AmiB activator)